MPHHYGKKKFMKGKKRRNGKEKEKRFNSRSKEITKEATTSNLTKIKTWLDLEEPTKVGKRLKGIISCPMAS